MAEIVAPRSASLADATPTDWDETGTVTVTRLISRASAGSELLTGVLTARSGSDINWTQADEVFETYYVVRGRLKVAWSRAGETSGGTEVGPDQAFFFAPGWTYQVQSVGDEEVFVVYGLTPAAG